LTGKTAVTRSKISSLTALSILLLAAPAQPAQADPVFPRGSRVGLEAPATMVLSQTLPRFEDAERKAAITIIDLPGPALAEFQSKLFETASDNIVTVNKREAFITAGGVGFLLTMQLNENGQRGRKWVLLTSSNTPQINNLTALVSVDVPEEATGYYTDEKVRAALATVSFRSVPTEEQLSLLPYRVGNLADFRVVQIMPPAGVILTDGPPERGLSQPGMIISVMPQEQSTEASERGSFSVELLRSFGLPDIRITNSETLRLKGQPVFEVRAEATDPNGGAPITVVQWIRFGEGGFTRIIGMAPSTKWVESFPRFRAVRDGIGPKEN
jgi:hypothetical protein